MLEVFILQPKDFPAVGLEELFQAARARAVGLEEAQRPDEILVVIVIAALVGQRVHLIGSRREEQYAGVLVLKEAPRQFAVGVPPIEEVLKALELIEDHEVRFERPQTRHCQEVTELSDEDLLIFAIL